MEEDKRNDVQHMRIALGMCGIGVSNCTAEIILRTFEATDRMGGDFDLMTAAKIQTEVEEKYAQKFTPGITINGLEEFYNDTVNQIHSRGEEDPLTVDMIIKALSNLIETHRDIPI
jgi:hypothetical protein